MIKEKPSEEDIELFKKAYSDMVQLTERLKLAEQKVAGIMYSAALDGLSVSAYAEAVGMCPRNATAWARKKVHLVSRSEGRPNLSELEHRLVGEVGYIYVASVRNWAEVDEDAFPTAKEFSETPLPSGRMPFWSIVKRDVIMKRGIGQECIFLAQVALGVDREWFRDHTVNYRDGNPLNCKRDNLEPVPRARAVPSGNSKTSQERRRKLLK